ncbi:MAG: S1C family serine protease [Oscillospiraceae bacterium]|nr:S1C family serine protease [Oscillospiraceae bacterium]
MYQENNEEKNMHPNPMDVNSMYQNPVNNDPVYSSQIYGNSVHNEPVYYSEPRNVPATMYSPGICVNQPDPRMRENDSINNPQRDRSQGLVSFIRAMALVLACTFFSAAAAYVVMDYRFDRGDFAQPAPVILGGNAIERPRDENPTIPIMEKSDELPAQEIYDMARYQVVGINTEAPGLFGLPDLSGSSAPISGSGFIVSSDGYILTNYHVIEVAHKSNLAINVVLNDGTSYVAKVVGYEASNDVAVIKIEATGLTPSVIGNSDNIRVGQAVYAVGNPFGDLVYTMTDGIVSALDRVVSVEGKSIRTFQFSAAVNRGNSGGPIYNTNGEVIGIVTAKFVRGNVEGIGFAIPINDAIEIASELIEHGYISGRPLMGITGQTVSDANADYFGWVVGVYVRSVAQGSAAENAGMMVGDIIIALNGEETSSMEALRFNLRDHRAGDTTTITIWRDGESIDLTITFDEDLYAGQPQNRPDVTPDIPDPFDNQP